MIPVSTYKYYAVRPSRLTAEFVRDEYAALADRVADADAKATPDAWLDLFNDWNALTAFGWGERSRIHYAYSKDMASPELDAAERYVREEVSPAVIDGESVLVNALLASPHRKAIAERYSDYLIVRAEAEVKGLDPVNRDLRIEASELGNDYSKRIASAEVVIAGEKMTLVMAGSYASDPDRDVRQQAFTAVSGWVLKHREELAAIYNDLVKLRTRMAQNVGFDTYVPLGYLDMGRTDYGPDEAATFRENVKRHAVPLLARIRERQSAALGLEKLRPWDTGFDPSVTLPRQIAPIDTQIERAQRIFDALHPRLASHFQRMRGEGLIDLENRRGKQSGAFCTTFPDEGRPAILCNSTGDANDVRTLLHEMGHAFQKWESADITPVTLQAATADVAEMHSMGMEYLSLRHIDEFFDTENAGRFRLGRWQKAILLICYVAIVDEFQHWVYEHPNATLDERDESWRTIWNVYEPGVDYSGVENTLPTRWYLQQHIFRSPFYYIDYAIAETAAMQIALIDMNDHERAMDIYLKLCAMGGTRSLMDVVASVGLRSPFDEDLMKELMHHAAQEIGM